MLFLAGCGSASRVQRPPAASVAGVARSKAVEFQRLAEPFVRVWANTVFQAQLKSLADLFVDTPQYNAHGTVTEVWLSSRCSVVSGSSMIGRLSKSVILQVRSYGYNFKVRYLAG